MSDRLIYLASPYSHTDPAVREHRFQKACQAAATLMSRGVLLFAPICHTHPIAMAGDLPKGWNFWQRYDRIMVERCEEVWVLMLVGWRESKGVMAEIALAEKLGKPVKYMEDRATY
jgi:hypothetical protein